MAFFVTKINSEIICPICKKKASNHLQLLPPYDCSVEKMCEDCYNLLYKNAQLDRIAAKYDDSLNYSVKRRSADSLEKKDGDAQEPQRGYEYVFPHLTKNDIIRECLSWLIYVVFFNFVFGIYLKLVSNAEAVMKSSRFFYGSLIFFTLILLIRVLLTCIKFKHYGVGSSRFKALLFAGILYGAIILCFVLAMT